MEILSHSEWKQKVIDHNKRVLPYVEDFRGRRARRKCHPVNDFLFTYYSHRPGQLLRWSPGIGFGLEVKGDDSMIGSHFKLENKICSLDFNLMTDRQKKELVWIHNLMKLTSTRSGIFKCFGLHEWAMVYRASLSDIRHEKYPLRMTLDQVNSFLNSQKLCCSHYDAFRFFTTEARSMNNLELGIDDRMKYEQPACLHTNMDLYKWSYKLSPWMASEVVVDAFLLALEIRQLDMRASPYDLRSLGYEPIRIETASGREEYESLQRDFSLKAKPIRQRILNSTEEIIKYLEINI